MDRVKDEESEEEDTSDSDEEAFEESGLEY